MNLTGPRGNWVVTIWLVALGIGYLYFLFLPTSREIHKLRKELDEKHAFIAQDAGLKGAIAATKAGLGDTESYVNLWKKNAPRLSELSSLFGEINRRTKTAGTKLENLDPQAIVEYAWLRKIPVRLTISGSFSQIVTLLNHLEELPSGLWVEDLKIDSGSGPGKALQGEVKLAIFTGDPENSD